MDSDDVAEGFNKRKIPAFNCDELSSQLKDSQIRSTSCDTVSVCKNILGLGRENICQTTYYFPWPIVLHW